MDIREVNTSPDLKSGNKLGATAIAFAIFAFVTFVAVMGAKPFGYDKQLQTLIQAR